METPNYIKSLLSPNGKKPAGRKAWSIDLETVWIPFFTATNTVGETQLPSDSLGAPLRLAYEADGSVRFSKTGRPINKVVKPLAEAIRMVRDNFSAGLLGYTEQVIAKDKAGFRRQVELARKAGSPIVSKDRINLSNAMAEAMADALAKAEAEAEAVAVAKPEAVAKGKAKVPVTA